MGIKKLTKDAFNNFVDGLIASEPNVIGVQAKGDRFAFAPLQAAEKLRLDYDVTILPPKKYFQPPVETLLTYEVPGPYKSVRQNDKLILIGVHPYDMIAINQMDILFSQDEYDHHYMDRRKNITIIACDVVTPSRNVFASSMQTAVVKEGYDILLTDIGDGFILDAPTEKGQSLLEKAAGAAEPTQQDLKKRDDIQKQNQSRLDVHKLKCEPSELPGLLEKAYEHPIWEEKARTCYSCGSCNLVCPTCYCFDVQDDVNWDLKSGKRYRAWDGCLLESFALVAGGHNFRKARGSRFRHRMYRKAKYVPAKIGGQIACVGCGRCVTACVPDIANPVEVYNRLVEDVKIKR
jgi:sulfhydrogenase subunit beta (sulfur reductase)